MQHAQLMSHVDTDIVARAELRALPASEATEHLMSTPPSATRSLQKKLPEDLAEGFHANTARVGRATHPC